MKAGGSFQNQNNLGTVNYQLIYKLAWFWMYNRTLIPAIEFECLTKDSNYKYLNFFKCKTL